MLIQSITNSFRAQILQAIHDLSTDTIKMALYTGAATLTPETTIYTTDGEVSGTGYVAGGVVMTGVSINTSAAGPYNPSVVYVNFDNVTFNAAVTARGALIYNASKGNKSVAVIDFGSDKVSTTTFTVQMPVNTSTSALLRFN